MTLRELRSEMDKRNELFPQQFIEVPRSEWPKGQPPGIEAVWRNRDFLVQIYTHESHVRLSVIRTQVGDNGRFEAGISWEQLQWIKSQVGFGDRWAVECYPPDSEVVNEANMRHLWLIDAPTYGWRKS